MLRRSNARKGLQLKCQRKQEKEAHFNHKTGFTITEIKKADTGMSPAK